MVMPIFYISDISYVRIEACLLKQLQPVTYCGVLLNRFSKGIAKDEYRVEEALNRVIRKPIEPCHLIFNGDPGEHCVNLSIEVLSDFRDIC
jgi:hypothetical protein